MLTNFQWKFQWIDQTFNGSTAIFKASTDFGKHFNELEDFFQNFRWFVEIFVDSLNFSLKIRWNLVKSTKILFVDSLNSFRWFRWFVEFVEKINGNKKQRIIFWNSSTKIKNNEFFSTFFGALVLPVVNSQGQFQSQLRGQPLFHTSYMYFHTF